MGNVLVAYGSKTGSTAEVAEAIAKTLREKGHEAEALPFAQIHDPGRYSAFVVGAPINGMRWMPEAMSFVSRNAKLLEKAPTAYFLLSAVLIGGYPFMQGKARACLDAPSALVKPVKKGAWGGVLSSDPPLILRLAFGIKKGSSRDGRDWNAIRAWAEEFAEAV